MATSSSTSQEITRITEHVTETLNFEMTSYLQLKSMGAGEFVSSPVFEVGGYDWDIKFYPSGANKDECEGHASSFLRYLGQAKGVSAKFTLSMLETTGGQKQVAGFGIVEDRAFSPGSDWGYKKFADRSQLKSLSRLGDGRFTVRCVLTVRNESRPMKLPGRLERMLRDGRGADVTFGVGGREFRAHGALLAARSPAFEAKLFDDHPVAPAEKGMRRLEVTDVEPAIFEMMLHYIYTDSLPPCGDDGEGYSAAVMQHLLVAAEGYDLDRLKQICEEELCKRMDVETVMATLAFANQHGCEQLKAACVGFMSSTGVMAAVVETDGFREHLKTCPRPLCLEEPKGEEEKATINRQEIMIQPTSPNDYIRTI